MVTNRFPVARGPLASRVFQLADQQRFAEFSGDFNPMHLDALDARRTQAGRVVVHGMYQLLWALELLSQLLPANVAIRALRVRFPQFLFLEEGASLSLLEQDGDMLRLSITASEVVTANIVAYLAFGQDPQAHLQRSSSSFENRLQPTCRKLKFEDMEGLTGNVTPWSSNEDAERFFPAAARLIGAGRVNAIAALSQLVGMVCPGLHSIFSALDIRLVDTGAQNSIRFFVSASDRRFSHVQQRVSGAGIEGQVKGFMRQPPAMQKSLSEVAKLVDADEFAGAVALVVGASRGLGEFVAKVIAAGGGHVLATYSVGRAECEELAEEIRAFGGRCDVLAYDARRPAAEQLEALPAVPRSVYYFATTKIFGRPGKLYDAMRFREFTQVYVDGFYDLCCCLRPQEGEQLSVVYPSSIAVETRPADMTAYAMAKAAGEVLCSDMNRFWPGLTILSPRLPRLATDQTATIAAIDQDTTPVSEILLPIIREAEHHLLNELRFS